MKKSQALKKLETSVNVIAKQKQVTDDIRNENKKQKAKTVDSRLRKTAINQDYSKLIRNVLFNEKIDFLNSEHAHKHVNRLMSLIASENIDIKKALRYYKNNDVKFIADKKSDHAKSTLIKRVSTNSRASQQYKACFDNLINHKKIIIIRQDAINQFNRLMSVFACLTHEQINKIIEAYK